MLNISRLCTVEKPQLTLSFHPPVASFRGDPSERQRRVVLPPSGLTGINERDDRAHAPSVKTRGSRAGFQKLSGYFRGWRDSAYSRLSSMIAHLSRVLVNHSVNTERARRALLHIMASTVRGCSGILRSRYRPADTGRPGQLRKRRLVPPVKP